MRTKLTILFAFMYMFLSAQSKDEVLAEAYLLYKSEKASWHGTDIFMQRFPDKKDKAGGYLSYSEGEKHKCIFYSNEDVPSVLATITFDDSFIPEAANVDASERKLTSYESDLYVIREKAFNEVIKDTILFKHYRNTNLNAVPLIYNDQKKVYFLTGPSVTGVVVFGNDYLITFDKNNNIRTKKTLHKNIIPIEYNGGEEGVTTMHNHLEETGDLMTATDICTLMLYCPYAGWDKHIVISEKNVSIWDCEKNELFVTTREAWEKIANDNPGDKED